jgi:hypothetical protein
MRFFRQVAFTLLFLLGAVPQIFADTRLTSLGAGSVPNDAETYYIDSTVTAATASFDINGILEIRSGGKLIINTGATIQLDNQGGGNSCFINIKSGGEMEIPGGTLSIGVNTGGSVTVDGGTIKVNGGTLHVGRFSGAGGEVTLNNGAQLLLTAGTINTNEAGSATLGTIHVNSGAAFNISGGTFNHDALLGGKLNVNKGGIVSINILNILGNGFYGKLIEVFGSVYTFGTLNNGGTGGGSFGTMNINYGGEVYLLGGTIADDHTSSIINVKRGGTLNNYHGITNFSEANNLSVESGGKFVNIGEHDPGAFTLASGGIFTVSDEIILVDDIDIEYTWTITVDAIIVGRGHEITFGTNGKIFVENGVTLKLLDVTFNNVSGNKIELDDNASTLFLEDVVWNQDADFTFATGKLDIQGTCKITGDNTEFIYQSTQQSTIQEDGVLEIKKATFKYNTTPSNLLNMFDDSSTIFLNKGTFAAAKACTLADGTLTTNKKNAFISGSLNLTSLDNYMNIAVVGGSGTTLIIVAY